MSLARSAPLGVLCSRSSVTALRLPGPVHSSQFTVDSSLVQRRSDGAFEPCEHRLDLSDSNGKCALRGVGAEAEVDGQLQLALQLVSRAGCNLQETNQFPLRSPTAAFCDIRRNRKRRPTHLLGQTESLRTRKACRESVDARYQPARSAPGLEVSIVLHARDVRHGAQQRNTLSRQSTSKNCGLSTVNCELALMPTPIALESRRSS